MDFIGDSYTKNESVFDFDLSMPEDNCNFEPLQPFEEYFQEALEPPQGSVESNEEPVYSDESRSTVVELATSSLSSSQLAEACSQCNTVQSDAISACWLELINFKKAIQSTRERQLTQLVQKKGASYFPKSAQRIMREWYLASTNQYATRTSASFCNFLLIFNF